MAVFQNRAMVISEFTYDPSDYPAIMRSDESDLFPPTNVRGFMQKRNQP
jgi:hypothetical protein